MNPLLNQRTLIRRYELLERLEEQEEYAAVSALLEIWDPAINGRAIAGGVSLLERLRKELKIMRERLLELEFDAWLGDASNQQRWEIVLREDPEVDKAGGYQEVLRNLVVDRFMLGSEFAYKQIWEYVDYRARQAIKELHDDSDS